MDSANALIASARNLMQAVALTVKAAYVACTAVSQLVRLSAEFVDC